MGALFSKSICSYSFFLTISQVIFACMCIMNVILYVNKQSDRYSVNSFLEQKVKMAEKYLGKARHYKRGNELLWKYRDIVLDDYGNIVLDDDGSLVWLNLRWKGCNDTAWWTKAYKDYELCKGRDGKTYRIDFTNCNVYEVVSE